MEEERVGEKEIQRKSDRGEKKWKLKREKEGSHRRSGREKMEVRWRDSGERS